jgi:limonene 1,2-monooxygenase
MGHKGLIFGIFLAPFHRLGDNPTLAMRRDMELIEWLDELGYDEAWIGEHHSAGWEIIASPELFIAAAAERTRNIRLGSGVTSLPYHHPYMVAQRFVQLDHMTRGRAMLGCGPERWCRMPTCWPSRRRISGGAWMNRSMRSRACSSARNRSP